MWRRGAYGGAADVEPLGDPRAHNSLDGPRKHRGVRAVANRGGSQKCIHQVLVESRPAQCDSRVGDMTYMPRTLAAPSPTTAEREKRKEREEKREKKFGARYARAATTGYLHREGQN